MEGDEIAIKIAGDRRFLLGRNGARDEALARLRAVNQVLPPGFRFSRDEASER